MFTTAVNKDVYDRDKKKKSENPNTLVRMPLAKDVGFLLQQSEICQKKKKKC